jgi:stage II sporulation protein R
MKKRLNFKKIIYVILVCCSINIFEGCTSIRGDRNKDTTSDLYKLEKVNKNDYQNRVLNYDEVKDSLIRFHVIANSDNDDDQNLKIKVKNKVIEYLYPYLNDSKSLNESRQIIKDRMQEVKKLAEEVIKENNYKYPIQTELSRENFPEKSYGNITLPQGNYEAFRIIIGDGQGRNWWCVMFPPLCFVDESKAEIEYDKTEERINSEKKEDDIQIKFKIVEVFNKLFN